MEAMLEEQGLSYLTATGAVFLAYGIWNQVEGRKKMTGNEVLVGSTDQISAQRGRIICCLELSRAKKEQVSELNSI